MWERHIRLADHRSAQHERGSADYDRSEMSHSIRFGKLLVFPSARLVERDGQPLPLGSRAFDVLIALLRSQGHVVSKEEIIRHVWPSTVVEEANLRVQMALLRKMLGSERDLIKTVPGRGYLAVIEHQAFATSVSKAAASMNVSRFGPDVISRSSEGIHGWRLGFRLMRTGAVPPRLTIGYE